MTKIGSILRKSPALYRVACSLYTRLQGLADMPRYLRCRLSRRVYFGPLMLSAQTWKGRDPHMRAAINHELRKEGRKEEFRVLEIGSWAGQSAILWASELTRSGRLGRIFCIDPWMPFAGKKQVGLNAVTYTMDKIARRDRIFPLFWHNVKSAGFSDIIVPLRGRSADVLPLLNPMSFDLIFVDGSHAYSDFTKDILYAAPLVKETGIICGDDLELQQDTVDIPFAEANRDKDFVTDPKTGQNYHPGVCLGTGHFFKRRVSCYDGFWIQRRVGEDWQDVEIRFLE